MQPARDPFCATARPSRPRPCRIALLASLLALLCGVFASQASAALTSWSSQGPDGGHLYALAIDPANHQTVYAATGGGGVFKSTDGGGSWSAASNGLSNTFVYSLAFDPDAPAALYAGTGRGVFRSTNGGANWAQVGSGLPGDTAILSLALVPGPADTIFAGTSTDGVYRSTNGGANWAQVGTGDFTDAWVRSLAIAPNGTIYAGTGFPGGGSTFNGGVFRSTNGGDTWGEVGLDTSEVRALAIAPGGTIYAGTDGGLFSSANGTAWGGLPLSGNVIALAIDPTNPQTIYAGTRDGGVFKSTNGGAGWSAASNGLSNTFVYALAIDPSNHQTVYAGTVGGGGVFKTTNGGATWGASGTGLTGAGTLSLAIDPSAPQTAYTGTASGVFKRTAVGVGWGAANSGLIPPNRFANALAIDRANPQTLYAGTDGIADPGANDGVFKSTNGGAGWTGIGLDGMAVHALAIDPTNSQIVYAGTDTTVYRTTNGGTTWGLFNTGLGAGGVHALAIAADRTLYAGTGDGVYRRAATGGNWAEVGASPAPVYSLAIDPANSRTVYAGTGAAGVFKSANGGAWVQSGPAAFVASLAIDPANPQIVYAGTEATVYRTTDGGGTWSPFNAGLGGGAVNALAVAPSGGVVYAGTTSGGVFTYGDASPPGPAQPAPGPSTPLVAQVHHGSKAPHGGAGKARFRLTPGQLLINQRISQAAIRRLNAVEAWLHAGIVERDLAGHGIGTRELGAGIEAAAGPVVASRPASPRPVTPKRGKRGNASGIEVSTAQLLINQRISQAAVRRANALEKRVEGGLTGGDVHDGAISAAILTQGLAIVSTSPVAAIAASKTKVAKAKRGNPGAVTLTTGQLRINQRISQAAVRGSNRLIGILEAGLSGRNFRAGSLSSADLAPSLR